MYVPGNNAALCTVRLNRYHAIVIRLAEGYKTVMMATGGYCSPLQRKLTRPSYDGAVIIISAWARRKGNIEEVGSAGGETSGPYTTQKAMHARHRSVTMVSLLHREGRDYLQRTISTLAKTGRRHARLPWQVEIRIHGR